MILHIAHLIRWTAVATEWMAIVMLGNSLKKEGGQSIRKHIEPNDVCTVTFFPKVEIRTGIETMTKNVLIIGLCLRQY
jgi:hypothetical protein